MDDLHNNAVEEGCQEGRRGGNNEPMDDVNPVLHNDAVEEGWQDSRRDGPRTARSTQMYCLHL